jgi:hypothetical protein
MQVEYASRICKFFGQKWQSAYWSARFLTLNLSVKSNTLSLDYYRIFSMIFVILNIRILFWGNSHFFIFVDYFSWQEIFA